MKKFIKGTVLVLGMAMAGWTAYVSNCQEIVSDINTEDIEALAGYDFYYYHSNNVSGTDVGNIYGYYNTDQGMAEFVNKRCPYEFGSCNTPMSGHNYIHVDGKRQ